VPEANWRMYIASRPVHHAHKGAGDYAEELFEAGPALYGGSGEVVFGHPSIDYIAELRHLQEALGGDCLDGDVLFDFVELGLYGLVVV